MEPHERQSSPSVPGNTHIIIDVVRGHGSWDAGMVWVYAHLVEYGRSSADCTGPWCQELLVESVNRALDNVGVLLAGLDQTDSARALRNPSYSPLRTLIEQARTSAARVTEYLRAQARA
ncbi:hypothetical protein [Micromonospora sp. HUAS LYJ1]|uniref:hypothetical protein n=1 Tax=Micromonospora sp. HUAS LYJ1 TaxID=3061626 RepID=UPI002672018E|nr:hypothetical protein [Micromonospora sp. HUAS LYJ1]WKU05500.1 hypothetical protein Q2K16_00045 [Micromonospora sp. HUAS LYJ1]